MSKALQNKSKGLLAMNLGDGTSVHVRPREVIELTDKQLNHSEVVKHLAKGRLIEAKPSRAKAPKPAKAKVSNSPPKADAKSEVKSATDAGKKDTDK